MGSPPFWSGAGRALYGLTGKILYFKRKSNYNSLSGRISRKKTPLRQRSCAPRTWQEPEKTEPAIRILGTSKDANRKIQRSLEEPRVPVIPVDAVPRGLQRQPLQDSHLDVCREPRGRHRARGDVHIPCRRRLHTPLPPFFRVLRLRGRRLQQEERADNDQELRDTRHALRALRALYGAH